MNRRTKERLDLRLQCRLGPEKILSVPSEDARIIGLTENLSRDGMLMRWLENVELPPVGSHLTVDVELPSDASFGRRTMRCRTTVVRLIRSEGAVTVGLKIRNIRFVTPRLPLDKETPSGWDLESMTPATERLN